MPNQPATQYSNLTAPFEFISFQMDFDTLYKHYFDQLTYIAMRLILIDDLPKTIDETYMKYCILCLGKVVFFKLDQDITDLMQSAVIPLHPGDLVALNGAEADMQTVYHMHRNVIVNNPAFHKSYRLTPGEDCEVVYCTEPDRYKIFGYGGLFALIARTATILADNDISINCAQKNTRLTNIIGADDAITARSAQAAVEAMYQGKPYTIAQKSLVSDLVGIPMTQRTATQDIVQLIEMRQYIYSHFYESLGLQTHDNMKKERLITDEINDNEEISALNIDDILVSISEGIDRVNKMFGTNIRVRLNPIVQRAHDEDKAAGVDPADLEDMELDPDGLPEEDPEEDPEENDIFSNYDNAELRRIIAGLKQSMSEGDAAASDPSEPDPEQDPDQDSEPETEPEPEPEPEPEQEPEPEPEQEVKIEVTAEDNAEVTIEIQQVPEPDPEPEGEEVKEDDGDPDPMEGRSSDTAD